MLSLSIAINKLLWVRRHCFHIFLCVFAFLWLPQVFSTSTAVCIAFWWRLHVVFSLNGVHRELFFKVLAWWQVLKRHLNKFDFLTIVLQKIVWSTVVAPSCASSFVLLTVFRLVWNDKNVMLRRNRIGLSVSLEGNIFEDVTSKPRLENSLIYCCLVKSILYSKTANYFLMLIPNVFRSVALDTLQ